MSSKNPTPDSVDKLVQRIQKERALRIRLVSRLLDAFEELGVKPEDISLLPPLDVVPKDLDKAGPGQPPAPQIVFISTSDSKKNTKSIIIF
jgi:hypothetical protein